MLSTQGAADQTISDFFSEQLTSFGSTPLDTFFQRLSMGHYDPEVVQTKARMLEKWKRESIRKRKAYHSKLFSEILIQRSKIVKPVNKPIPCAKSRKLTPHNGNASKVMKGKSTGGKKPLPKESSTDSKRGKKRAGEPVNRPCENGTVSSDDDVVIISPPGKKKSNGSQNNKKPAAPKKKTNNSAKKPKKVYSPIAHSSPSTLPVSVLPTSGEQSKLNKESGVKLANLLPSSTPSTPSVQTTSIAKNSPILASQLQAPVSLNLNLSPMLDGNAHHPFNSSSCITLNYPNKTSDKSSEEDENESSSDEFETIEPTIGFGSETRVSVTPTIGRTVITQSGQIKTFGSKSVVVLTSSGAQVQSPVPKVVVHHNNSVTTNSSPNSGYFLQSSSGAKMSPTASFAGAGGVSKMIPISLSLQQNLGLKKTMGTSSVTSLLPAELLSQLQNNVAASGSFGSISTSASSMGTSTATVLDSGLSNFLHNRSTSTVRNHDGSDGDLNLSMGDLGTSLNLVGSGLLNLGSLDGHEKMEIDGMDKIDDLSVLDGNPFDSIPNLSDELDGLDLDMVDDLCDFE